MKKQSNPPPEYSYSYTELLNACRKMTKAAIGDASSVATTKPEDLTYRLLPPINSQDSQEDSQTIQPQPQEIKMNNKVNQADTHLDLLGLQCTDKVTQRVGIITSVSFDLYGCVQVIITPEAREDGTVPNTFWLDAARVKVDTAVVRVMPTPDFAQGYIAEGKKGPAEKPVPS